MKCETSLETGLRKVRTEKCPGMVIIHKSSCGICKKLRPMLLASNEINRLSEKFVVISLEDDAEPQGKLWLPDGKYFPRIFFLDSSGHIMKEIMNTDGSSKYKYFYQSERSLIRSMERVLDLLSSRHQEIDRLSNSFVVIVLKDDDESSDSAFSPDGAYVPRIFFLSPSGQIILDVFNNQGDARYKYFYTSTDSLVANMKKVMAFKTWSASFRILRQIKLGHESVRHFGRNLKWERSLESGLKKVKERQRPGMVVCHKSWCGACRALKPKFETSKDIELLSVGFVLISLEDDDLPKEHKYMPDGDYVPRVLFLTPQAAIMTDITNEGGSNEYKYFYSEPEHIASSMKKVLRIYPGT